MEQPKNRTEDTALHGKEERVKRIFRDQIAEAAGILEVVLSGIVLVGPAVQCCAAGAVDAGAYRGWQRCGSV